MSENLWTFCLFATYPKKMTTYPFFMVGIAFVVYLLDILDLKETVFLIKLNYENINRN